MNREIKFRAWDKKKNRFYMPPEPFDSFSDGWGMTSDGRIYVDGVYQDLILEQFTGLHDKNGNEIYEGDIVRNGNHKINNVFFRSGSFCTYIDMESWLEMSQNSFDFEVIGNIHENPELLED